MSTSKVILPAASSYSSFSRHSSHANQNGACGHVSLIGSQEELKMSPCDSPGACFQANQNGTCDHVPLTDMQEEVEVSACDGPDAYFQTNQNGACGHVPLIDTQCEKESNCESVDSSDSSSEDSGDHVPLIDTQDEKESTYEKYTSCRWTLTYLGFLMNMLVYCVRNSMSMTLLCMDDVKKGQRLVTGLDSNITMLPVGYKGNGSFLEDEDNSLNSTILSPQPVPDYIPDDMQGVVLSAYFYGFSFTPLAGGVLAERFGGRLVVLVAMTTSAAFTFLTPSAIRLNLYLAVILRCLTGMILGLCTPALMSMWSDWAPVHETAKLVAFSSSGINAGIITANLVSGFLCIIPVDEGWPFILYTYGALTVLWAVFWQFVVRDKPASHPRISQKERRILKLNTRGATQKATNICHTPLKSILTSVPFLALMTAYMGDIWLYCMIGIYVPLYLSQMLHFDTQTSGALSALPFVSCLVCTWLFAALSDRVTVGGWVSVTNNRKLFQFIGSVGPAAILCGLSFLDLELRSLAITLIIILNGLLAAGISGIILNRIDLAPRYAGSIAGLTISLGNSAQIICPLIVSDIISDNQQESWNTVFVGSAILSLLTVSVYLAFASGEEQEWAKDKSQDERESL